MREKLVPGLFTSVLSLAKTGASEALAQLNTSEGCALLDSFASPGAPSRTRSRVEGEDAPRGSEGGTTTATAAVAAPAPAREEGACEQRRRGGKKRKGQLAVAVAEGGDAPALQVSASVGEAVEAAGANSKRSRKQGQSASGAAEAGAAAGQPASATTAAPLAANPAADAVQTTGAGRKRGRPTKGKGKHAAAAAGAPAEPAAPEAAGAVPMSAEVAAAGATTGKRRGRESGKPQLLAAPATAEAELASEETAGKRRGRQRAAPAAGQAEAELKAAGGVSADPVSAAQAAAPDQLPGQASLQPPLAAAKVEPAEPAAQQGKSGRKRAGKQPGRQRQPATALAAAADEAAEPADATAAAAAAAAPFEAGAQYEIEVAAEPGPDAALQQAAEAAPAAVAAPPAGGKKRGRKPLVDKQLKQASSKQLQQKGRQQGQVPRQGTAGAVDMLHQQGPAEGPLALAAEPVQGPAGQGVAQGRGAGATAAADQQQPQQQRDQQHGACSMRAAAPAALAAAWEGHPEDEEDEEEAFYREQRMMERLRRRKVTGNHQGPRSPTSQPAAAASTVLVAGKRERKASRKVAENEETDALLAAQLAEQAAQRAQQAAQRAQQGAQRVQQAGGAPAGPLSPRALRRGGMGGMAGFAASGAKGPAHQPMALLPGEEPLGLELFFGEGRTLKANGRAGAPPPADGEGQEGSRSAGAGLSTACLFAAVNIRCHGPGREAEACRSCPGPWLRQNSAHRSCCLPQCVARGGASLWRSGMEQPCAAPASGSGAARGWCIPGGRSRHWPAQQRHLHSRLTPLDWSLQHCPPVRQLIPCALPVYASAAVTACGGRAQARRRWRACCACCVTTRPSAWPAASQSHRRRASG